MVCSKCGKECSPDQAFCVYCGNPIDVMPDFNLIEKEIASNVDEMMNQIEEENRKSEDNASDDGGEMKTVDVPIEEINMELKMVDISRGATQVVPDIRNVMDDEDDIEKDMESREDRIGEKEEKSKKKKLFIGIGCGVFAVVLIVVAVILLNSGKTEKNSSFNDIYNMALNEVENNSSKAVEMALNAVKKASSDKDILKARLLLNKAYEINNIANDDYAENLEEILKLDGENSQCQISLGAYYYSENKLDKLNKIILKMDEGNAKKILGDDYVAIPMPDVQSGEYDNHVVVNLTAEEEAKIYYAVDEDISSKAILYSEKISFLEPGKYTVYAYAEGKSGIYSPMAKYEYEVVEGEKNSFSISPESGTYYEYTDITITMDEGSTAYYTFDGSTPEKPSEGNTSTEYTGPFQMKLGVNTLKVIVVDKYGIESDQVSIQYNLKIPRNVSFENGIDILKNSYIQNGITDESGKTQSGTVMEFKYEDTAQIDNYEYYIYSIIEKDQDGNIKSIAYAGVSTYDGTISTDIQETEGQYIKIKE